MEFNILKGEIKKNYTGEVELVITLAKEINVEPIHELLTNETKEKVLTLEYKKKRRSLNSNSYCWALVTQIADVLRSSKEEVYLQMLKRYGQSSVVSVVEEAAEVFKKSVKYCEEFGQSVLNGKNFIHFKVYVGSSEFSTSEMAIFLDGIISECIPLKISTLTPAEIEILKEQWR